MVLALTPAHSKEFKVKQNQSHCLAQNVYYEAGSEDFGTKLAVAFVTVNRLNSHQFANSICDVVFQTCQFVWHCNRSLHKPKGKEWQESIKVAECVLNECMPNIIPDALYIHDYRIKYALKSKKIDIVLKTNGLIFYKYKHK